MTGQTKLVPVRALLEPSTAETLNAAGPRRMLDLADVVYAVSEDNQQNILLFGKDKLERIANSEIPEGARVLRVGMDRINGQLDHLLALIESVKGSHDYAESV